MSVFNRTKKYRQTSQDIEEKLKLLEKEEKKNIKEGMKTDKMYSEVEPVPEIPPIPAEYTDVPDSSGILDVDNFNQPGDETDQSTWDEDDFDATTLYKDHDDWLRNPAEMPNGQGTDNSIVLEIPPDLLADAEDSTGQGYYPPGSGLVLNGNYYGTAVGYISGGKYRGILSGGLTGGTNAPTEASRGYGGYYRSLNDKQFAVAVATWNAVYPYLYNQEAYSSKLIKCWAAYNRHHHYQRGGEYATWTGGPKSGGYIVEGVHLMAIGNKYRSSDFVPHVPAWNKVLKQSALGDGNDPENFPGPFKLLEKLFDKSKEALEAIAQKANKAIKDHHDKVDNWVDNITDPDLDYMKKGSEIGKKISDGIETGVEILDDGLEIGIEKAAQVKTTVGGFWAGLATAAVTDLRGYAKRTSRELMGTGGEDDIAARGGDYPTLSNTPSQGEYSASLGLSLSKSIGSGRSVMIDNSNVPSESVGQAMTKDDIDKMLEAAGINNESDLQTGRPDVSMDPDQILNPNKDGARKLDYFKDTKGYGGEGGSIMDIYKGNDGEIYIQNTADKTLRVGGESGEEFDYNPFDDHKSGGGKVGTFTDVPSPTGDQVKDSVKAAVEGGKFSEILGKAVTGQEFSDEMVRDSVEQITNDPAYNAIMSTLENDKASAALTGSGTGFVNAATAGALLYGKVKNVLGLKQETPLESQGGQGHVRRQNVIKLSDLKPEVRNHLQNKLGIAVTESVSYDFDKDPLVKKSDAFGNKQKPNTWFDPEDVQPEYPKKAPPKLKNNWHPKSPNLKKSKRFEKVKVSSQDLIRHYKVNATEIEQYHKLVDAINQFIEDHPGQAKLISDRYPAHDSRLAELNWKMDQMMKASHEYIEQKFPENEKVTGRIKRILSKTIKMTDPKSFKMDPTPPKYIDYKQLKLREDATRYFKKPVKLKSWHKGHLTNS